MGGILSNINSQYITKSLIKSLYYNKVVIDMETFPSSDKTYFFDEDIQNDCYDMLLSVKKLNKVVKIYYDDIVIHGIKYTCDSNIFLSNKMQPNVFGYSLEDEKYVDFSDNRRFF